MEITVKLFATLGKYLPPSARHNEVRMHIASGTSVSQLMRQLQLPQELTQVVMLNGSYIDPGDRDQTTLSPDDEFVVFPPIAGGQ